MQWFDAGVNCFDERLPAQHTLAAAREQGVERLCLISTHASEWAPCITHARQQSQVISNTLGIHPHYADDATDDVLDALDQLLSKKQAVAVGECGLDFNRMYSQQSNQQRVFEAQLSLAAKYSLPVYLHERDAFAAQTALLSQYRARLCGGLVHCFTGDTNQLKTYVDMGFYIGITGWLCDPKRGQALREAVKFLPLSQLILETDAPYLFPKSLKPRKRNNEPANLPHIGHTLAELLRVPVNDIAQASFANACELFRVNRQEIAYAR
ncbi:TatD family hydrolase [Alteromonas oceanisediminis]|uniref:TatD family hydrolase n=1 Tax=Alteromonas oceanisediminis TaxID=2836180 RepID=UPI001BDA39BD|nr:TatD family hydrolase [Alteromonas oceanisediminis]MBT0586041.1 TatD family hydrolase [Alteromonas oceanisediminis]